METIATLALLHSQHMADRQQCSCIFDAIGQDKDSATLQHYMLTFWKNDLQKHIDAEDHILLPFLHLHRFNSSYIHILHREHDTMRVLAQRLPLLNGNGTSFCKTFARMIDEHTSFEDEVLFQKMEEMIDARDLVKLEQAMKRETVGME